MSQQTARNDNTGDLQTTLDFHNHNNRFVHPPAEMDIAVADFIHSNGLAFRLAEDIKFKYILQLAQRMSPNYVPPKRKAISGALLDTIYNNYVANSKKQLNIDVDIFGLSIMGDGATIKKKPCSTFYFLVFLVLSMWLMFMMPLQH